jgi:enoyl-CoA hydratase/carnithine racemase
MVEKRLS